MPSTGTGTGTSTSMQEEEQEEQEEKEEKREQQQQQQQQEQFTLKQAVLDQVSVNAAGRPFGLRPPLLPLGIVCDSFGG